LIKKREFLKKGVFGLATGAVALSKMPFVKAGGKAPTSKPTHNKIQ